MCMYMQTFLSFAISSETWISYSTPVILVRLWDSSKHSAHRNASPRERMRWDSLEWDRLRRYNLLRKDSIVRYCFAKKVFLLSPGLLLFQIQFLVFFYWGLCTSKTPIENWPDLALFVHEGCVNFDFRNRLKSLERLKFRSCLALKSRVNTNAH